MKDMILNSMKYEKRNQIFWLLQLADVATTLWGFEIRLGEMNPLVVFMMQLTNPITGLLLVKAIIATPAYFYAVSRKWNAVGMVNDIYIFIVLWNLLMIACRYTGLL